MVSFVALPLIGLVLLLGLIGFVAMLIHPKTRTAGVVLLTVGGGMVVAVAFVSYMHFARTQRTVEEARMEAQWQEKTLQRSLEKQRELNEHRHDPGVELPAEPETVPAEPTPNEATDPAEETTSPPRTTSGRVLNGLLTSLRQAVAETKAEEEQPAHTGSDSETVPVVKEAPAPIPVPTPPPTPAWVGKAPRSDANEYRVAIDVGPCPSLTQCEAELPAAVERAVAQYVDKTLGHGGGIAAEVQLPTNFIEDYNIVQERWTEPFVFTKPIEGDDGSWTQLHALLVFDAAARQQIDQQCKSVIVADRLWYTGTGIAALLAVLAVLFGCLRIDQVTAGSHRGLLVTAAVAAVAAIVAGGYFALRPTAPESLTPESIATEHFTTSGPASAVAPASEDGAMADGAAERSAAGMRVKVILLPIAAVVVGLLVLMLAARRTRAAALVLLGLVAAGVLTANVQLAEPLTGSLASVGSMELAALIVLGVPILLISMFCREGWGWILGFLVCMAAAAFLTPPDPLSMVVVAAPLCGVYGAIGLAWQSHRNRKTAGEPTAT
ncbi:MAG: hypothetical protein HQ567_22055 [Candidatus Nealsonbacteria bacterium]|nr:hypothetical protein [Candidatus Nealsonbacteria bacterium]